MIEVLRAVSLRLLGVDACLHFERVWRTSPGAAERMEQLLSYEAMEAAIVRSDRSALWALLNPTNRREARRRQFLAYNALWNTWMRLQDSIDCGCDPDPSQWVALTTASDDRAILLAAMQCR